MNTPQNTLPEIPEGSLATAVAGDYDFSISDVLNEAWAATNGIKLAVHIALTLYSLVYLLVSVLTFYAAGGNWALLLDQEDWHLSLATTAGAFVSVPLMAGLMMMAVQHVQGRHVSGSMVGMCLVSAAPLLACYAVQIVGSWIGFMLFLVPGVYISVSWSFALLLVAEKNLPVWEALETSRKAVTHHWFKVFFTFFAAGVIVVISILPLGIGMIWSIPMMFTLYAVLYRRIFGLNQTFDA